MFCHMAQTNQIASRRKELGLSGYALARIVGITPTHLSEIENGEIKSPRVDIALKLADALNTDVKELFGEQSGCAA